MKISSHISLSLFHLSFLFLFSQATDYDLPNESFINCGSTSSATVDDYGPTRTFIGDRRSILHGGNRPVNDTTSSSSSTLYQTARIFRNRSGYELDIPKNATYAVRFHFFPFSSLGNLSQARFSVFASGFALLSNFSIGTRTNFPQIEEFFLRISPGKFRVDFVIYDVTSFAFINAMEVFLAPPDLLSGNYNGSSYRLRVIHRINVGGDNIIPSNDTLLRYWIPDDPFLSTREFATNTTPLNGQPRYQDTGATRFHAPPFVYTTAKEINISDSSQITNNLNITWRFDVRNESRHLVRLHFCDIVTPSAANPGLIFNVSIIGGAVQNLSDDEEDGGIFSIRPWDHIDLIEAPFYIDILVDSDDSDFIDISISPRNESRPRNAFLNGVEIMELITDSLSLSGGNDSGRTHLLITIGSVVGGLVLVLIVLGVFVFCFKRKKWVISEAFDWPLVSVFGGSSHTEKTTTVSGSNSTPLYHLNLGLKISFLEIANATKDFDAKFLIGSGGFGKVYKGTLRDGKKVAVKRSEPGHGQGLSEFQTEIMVLSKIRHNHLVSLIGYCDERDEMILVYEFMEKGTLRDHLYFSKKESGESSTSRSELSWDQRLGICIGAAKGIHYLHTGSTGSIIHRDIKSTNILLDEHYEAKVADFGLSMLGPLDQSHVSTDVKGSFGYLDPEYFRSLQLTQKSDVYSFGVVLLEVACARSVIDRSLPAEQINLADWGLSWQSKGQLEKILDPCLVGKVTPESLRKFGEMLEKCLQENGADRPNMVDVRWDLEYALQLQRTARPREPHEDSTSYPSWDLPMHVLKSLPSNGSTMDGHQLPDESHNFSDANGVNASELFSQLKIGESR